jgi:hypothetical protein
MENRFVKKKSQTSPPNTFEDLIQRKNDLEIFESSLEEEETNFLFCFMKISKYFETEDAAKKKNLFIDIYNNYFHEKSSNCLNLENKKSLNEKYSKATEIEKSEEKVLIQDSLKEILSVLRYIFQQFKRSKEWKNYISSTYNLDSKPLFEDIYTAKKNIKISNLEFIKVRKLNEKDYFNVILLIDIEENISLIRKEIFGIQEKLGNSGEFILPLIDIYDEINVKDKNKRELFIITDELECNLTQMIDQQLNENVWFIKNLNTRKY